MDRTFDKIAEQSVEVVNLRKELNKLKGVQSSLDKAQSNLDKSKRELYEANTKVINKERDIRLQKNEIEGRDRIIKSLKGDVDKLQRTAETHVEKMRGLKAELAKVETELEGKKIDFRRLEEQNRMQDITIQDMEKELHELKSSNENQAHNIRELQEKAFQHIEEGQWMPDTNREVSDQLNSLGKQLQRWSRTFSRRSVLRIDELTVDDQACLRKIISQVAHTVNGKHTFQFEDPAMGSRLPEVLLMSALSHDLYQAIFSNPFFFESCSLPAEDQPDASTGAALAKFWRDLLKGNSSNSSRSKLNADKD